MGHGRAQLAHGHGDLDHVGVVEHDIGNRSSERLEQPVRRTRDHRHDGIDGGGVVGGGDKVVGGSGFPRVEVQVEIDLERLRSGALFLEHAVDPVDAQTSHLDTVPPGFGAVQLRPPQAQVVPGTTSSDARATMSRPGGPI